MLSDAFLPLADLFIPPVTILDIALVHVALHAVALQASHCQRLRCQAMTQCLVIKSPHLLSDLHLLPHPWWYIHHHPAIILPQVMWSENVLTHENRFLLKVLGIQHEIQHEIQCRNLIAIILNYWNLMHAPWPGTRAKGRWTGSWTLWMMLGPTMLVQRMWHMHGLLVGPSAAPTLHAFAPMVDRSTMAKHTASSTVLAIFGAPPMLLKNLFTCSTSNALQLLWSGGTWEKSKTSVLNLGWAA